MPLLCFENTEGHCYGILLENKVVYFYIQLYVLKIKLKFCLESLIKILYASRCWHWQYCCHTIPRLLYGFYNKKWSLLKHCSCKISYKLIIIKDRLCSLSPPAYGTLNTYETLNECPIWLALSGKIRIRWWKWTLN